MRAAALALLFSGGLTAFAPRQSVVDATIDKATAAYARLKTARGTFEQTLTNPLTRSTMTARGEFQQDRTARRFALRFTDPKGDVIVADGTSLWVYLPSTNPGQVMKRTLGNGPAAGLDIVDRFLADPESRYRIADAGAATVAGRGTRALTLTPKEPMEFTRAVVWVDTADGTLRQFEVTEPSGLVRRVTLTTVRVNTSVDRGAFRFSPPKGVRVVDLSRMGR